MRTFFSKYGVYTLLIGFVSVFYACEKKVTELPPKSVSPEVQEVAKGYIEQFLKAPEGWVLGYQPEEYDEMIYFHLDFKSAEEVDITAGYKGYHTVQTGVPYHFEGVYVPTLVFDGENAFEALSELFNGSVKFKVYENKEAGGFELNRADGFNDHRFSLQVADNANLALFQEQIDKVLAQIAYEEEQERLSEALRLKIEEFVAIESDFYFYNFKTENFSAALQSFDTEAKEISLTYKETPNSAPRQVTVTYSITPEAILLEPAISYGNIQIDRIAFGDLTYTDTEDPSKATGIEVLSAGNAGAGYMGYAHEAPYPFTLSTDRSKTLVDYYLNDFPSSVQTREGTSPTAISPKGAEYSLQLRDALRALPEVHDEGRHIIGLYPPNHPTTTIQDLVWVGYSLNSGAASGGFNIRIAYENLGNNKLNLNQVIEQTNVTATRPDVSAQVQEFLNAVAPAEGVTLVAYDTGAGHRLRLVSTVDSRVWIEYRFLSATYWNLVFD